MNGLELSGVHKAFGELPVLRGIDLEVERGSFCSILGPSGSGKTTLLRVVAGFERADAGRVVLDGEVLEDNGQTLPPNRRRIGYVPQEGSLFPHLNVGANVGFGLERAERKGRRVSELLEMVGLSGYERRYPHELSGGQQQRVALARALAISPALVLLDEPFSSLDATLRQSVRADVRRVLKDAGTTVLLVTHDQDEALSLSDEVAVISEGRIGQFDTPNALYTRPRSPSLAVGLGDANLLPAVARGNEAETAFGRLPAIDTHPEGAALLVLVRPEQITLVAPDQGAPTGTVVEREYYGHDAIVRVLGDWDGGDHLTVRLADATALPAVGERVGVAVHGSVTGWERDAAGR